jgi:hypothetical protein
MQRAGSPAESPCERLSVWRVCGIPKTTPTRWLSARGRWIAGSARVAVTRAHRKTNGRLLYQPADVLASGHGRLQRD